MDQISTSDQLQVGTVGSWPTYPLNNYPVYWNYGPYVYGQDSIREVIRRILDSKAKLTDKQKLELIGEML